MGRERNGKECLGEKGGLLYLRLDRKCSSVFPGLQKQVHRQSLCLTGTHCSISGRTPFGGLQRSSMTSGGAPLNKCRTS